MRIVGILLSIALILGGLWFVLRFNVKKNDKKPSRGRKLRVL